MPRTIGGALHSAFAARERVDARKPFAGKTFGKTRRPGGQDVANAAGPPRGMITRTGIVPVKRVENVSVPGRRVFQSALPGQVSVASTSAASCKHRMQRPSDCVEHRLPPLTSHQSLLTPSEAPHRYFLLMSEAAGRVNSEYLPSVRLLRRFSRARAGH